MSEYIALIEIGRDAVYDKTSGRCFYCGSSLLRKWDKQANPRHLYTIDHFIPKELGGTEDAKNLVPACRFCNSSKRDRTLEQWRTIKARLSINQPIFSDEQIEYLLSIGIEIPTPPYFTFWFEEQNLQGIL